MKKIILSIVSLIFAQTLFVQTSWAQMYNPNMYGTGLSQAYPPCPYPQNTIADMVTKKSERFENALSSVKRKLKSARNKLDKYAKDPGYLACQKSVNQMIKLACGGGNVIKGNRAISDFEDHMRGSMYISTVPNYTKTYEFLAKNLLPNNLDRIPAGDATIDEDVQPDPFLNDKDVTGGDYDGGGITINESCVDSYGRGDGMIDTEMCDAGVSKVKNPSENLGKMYKNCRACLSPTGSFRRGLYPQRFREIYDLQQEIASLESAEEIAKAKVACAQEFIDDGRENISGFKSCVMDADPDATVADYCLTCDENGKEKKSGVEWSKWLPGLVSAGLWTAGGIFAYNQMEKTRQGNWEAGYPSDDRQPWVMTNYVMNGANNVMNTFKASGAFGCSQGGGLNGMGGYAGMYQPGMMGQFGGSPYMNMGGALGYNPQMMAGMNPGMMMGGGLYMNNPMAGPWGMQGSAGMNPQMQMAYYQNQMQMLQYQIQQGQQNMATLQAVAQLDAQMAQIQAQRQQLFMSNPGMMGYNGMGYNGYNTGIFGNIQANFGITGWGGVGSPGYTIPGMGGSITPPYVGPTGTNNNYVPTTPSTGTGSAVPSLGL